MAPVVVDALNVVTCYKKSVRPMLTKRTQAKITGFFFQEINLFLPEPLAYYYYCKGDCRGTGGCLTNGPFTVSVSLQKGRAQAGPHHHDLLDFIHIVNIFMFI